MFEGQLLNHVDMSTLAAVPCVAHWVVVGGLTMVLIPLSFVAFKYIEHPCINSTDRVLLWFRQLDRNDR